MTSPSAQKAAGEIIALLYANKWVRFHTNPNKDEAQIASIIQQAITEAVDAAVAQEKAKYLKLAEKWREKSARLDECYMNDSAIAADRISYRFHAEELESLVKEK